MFNSRGSWLMGGLAIGFIVGLNAAGIWPQIPVHASATHGQENFAICTAEVESDLDGVFLLDYVTGDLKGAVMSINTRTFLTFYRHNVAADFKHVKNPKFLMVSGNVGVRPMINVPIGNAVLYIAEMTTGQLVCYGVPWVPGRSQVIAPAVSEFLPMSFFPFRTTAIRNAE